MKKVKMEKTSDTMGENRIEESVKHQSISVQQWCEYAKAGIALPVKIPLYGRSMEPLIRYKKDIVTVIPLKRDLFPGDIVLFERADGAFVIHRIYKILPDRNEIQTWGDNCIYPDQPIKKECVLGLAVCVERDGKRIILDSQEQRDKGILWMNGSAKRKLWFAYKYFYSWCCKVRKFIIRLKNIFCMF